MATHTDLQIIIRPCPILEHVTLRRHVLFGLKVDKIDVYVNVK